MPADLTDQIIMKGLVLHSHVGVLPQEKAEGQLFELDVIFHCRPLAATATDLLSQTIDYGQAYHLIRKLVESAAYDLIEKLAGTVADALLQHYPLAEAVTVTVRKPEAPVDGTFDYMGVQIRRTRGR